MKSITLMKRYSEHFRKINKIMKRLGIHQTMLHQHSSKVRYNYFSDDEYSKGVEANAVYIYAIKQQYQYDRSGRNKQNLPLSFGFSFHYSDNNFSKESLQKMHSERSQFSIKTHDFINFSIKNGDNIAYSKPIMGKEIHIFLTKMIEEIQSLEFDFKGKEKERMELVYNHLGNIFKEYFTKHEWLNAIHTQNDKIIAEKPNAQENDELIEIKELLSKEEEILLEENEKLKEKSASLDLKVKESAGIAHTQLIKDKNYKKVQRLRKKIIQLQNELSELNIELDDFKMQLYQESFDLKSEKVKVDDKIVNNTLKIKEIRSKKKFL